ncbi:MAG TPA: hypothetical protein VGE01_05060 [Fimbriimonas sp.]
MIRKLAQLLPLIVLVGLAVSCTPKTEEEIEAAKYEKVPPLTPEEQAKAKELAGPVTGPPQ